MPRHDPRVDAYIAAAAPFARPVLGSLRERVHAACPDIEEAIKWGMPAFLHRGRLLASMGAFKAHATFAFRLGEAVTGPHVEGAMGQFGRLRDVADLPDEARMAGWVRRAVELAGSGAAPTARAARPVPPTPPEFAAALAADAAARAAFDAMTPGCRREYIAWIAEARRDDTRARRIAQALEWIAQGKPRNWKYVAR